MNTEYESIVIEFASNFWSANNEGPATEEKALAFLLSNMDDEVEYLLLKATGVNAFDLEEMLA